MAEAILMPRLSDTMTEGVIAAWHKKVGDPVKKGELLAEVETDKATMDLESYKDGTLLHIGTEKGGKLQVNDLLAIMVERGLELLRPGGRIGKRRLQSVHVCVTFRTRWRPAARPRPAPMRRGYLPPGRGAPACRVAR